MLNLGADGVQVGSRFAVTKESSGHDRFKQFAIRANEGDTQLTLKELAPVRMLKNTPFFKKVQKAYEKQTSKEDLIKLLGKGRAKKGMFEGNIAEGELELG